MISLNPYIHFLGNAREAMEFYADVFGGTLHIDNYNAAALPEATDDDLSLVMHAHLRTPHGLTLMGADVPSLMDFDAGSRVHISLSGNECDDKLLREFWERLTDGGRVTMPLDTAPWGSVFGALTDRFDVNWFVTIGDPTP